MLDLSEMSGLPLRLDGWKLIPGSPLLLNEPATRRVEDLREVMMDPRAVVKPEELYFMYRDTCLGGDERILQDFALRYDLTVIRPGLLGREYMKTAGHYHPRIEASEESYPEVYEVLSGTARYLLQKVRESGFPEREFIVEDVIVVEANVGDKVVMPPGYGHITINPGREPLVMANWVSRRFSSIYEPMVRTHGGAYYLLNAETGYNLVANGNYQTLPEPRFLCPQTVPEIGLISGKPMRLSCMEDPSRFAWLNNPAPFAEQIARALA